WCRVALADHTHAFQDGEKRGRPSTRRCGCARESGSRSRAGVHLVHERGGPLKQLRVRFASVLDYAGREWGR
ncbi:unnamed protein product, partial [Pylaiella littoralis]